MRFSLFPQLVLGASCGALLAGCGCRDDPVRPIEDVPTEDPNDIGQWLSMDTMPDGSPAVSFYDNTKGALAFAIGTVKDGKAIWDREEVDGYPGQDGLDPGDRGRYTSLALQEDGVAWITYYDSTNGALRYARRDADGEWETGIAGTGSGPSPDVGKFSSVALNVDGNPVVAFYDVGDAELRFSSWNGTGFSTEVVDEGTDFAPVDTGGSAEAAEADVGRYANLVSHGGVEYIAYYDAANGQLKLASGSGSGWSVETVDDGTETGSKVGAWPDIHFDGGRMVIAYQDVGNGDLRLAQGNPGGNWTLETIDSGSNMGADAAVYLDGEVPVVYYFDGYNNDIRKATREGNAWSTETVDGDSAALGFHIETATNGTDRFVACYDYTNRKIWFQVQ